MMSCVFPPSRVGGGFFSFFSPLYIVSYIWEVLCLTSPFGNSVCALKPFFKPFYFHVAAIDCTTTLRLYLVYSTLY